MLPYGPNCGVWSTTSCNVGRNIGGVEQLCLWWMHIMEVIADSLYL